MKRIIIILVILVSAFISKAQTPGYTTINSGYDWLRGLFKALGVPSGGTAGFQTGQAVRAGALYYDSTGTDSGLYVYSGLAWRKIDGITYTANEGLQINSNVVQLGGLVSSPAALSNDRHILANRRILSFSNTIANNNWWQFSDSLFSPFQFASTDTITSNDMSLSRTRPISTMNIQRNIVFASGIYQQTKMYGALRASTKLIWGDSVKVRTDGGDFHTNIVEFRFSPTGTGRQRAKIGHGTGGENDAGEALPALIANMYIDNPDLNSTDTTVINGTIAGIAPYLVGALGTAKIRIKRYISVQPNNFIGTGTFIEKYYDYASRFKVGTNSILVDSAYFMWDTSMFKRNHLRGSTHIGTGLWSNGYNFSVGGISNFSDTTSFSTVRNIADTTGYDIMTRRRTDGVLTRITSTQLSSFIGSSFSLAAVGSSPNANGASYSAGVFNLQPASISFPGVVTTGSQTFDGDKTWGGVMTFTNQARFESNQRLIEVVSPSSPPSGYGYFYPKSDGKLYYKNSAGTEYDLTTSGGTPSLTQYRLAIGDASNLLSTNAAITGNRALISDANGVPTHATTTATEIGYVNGVTSAIQTQIDGKANTALSNLASVAINTSLISDANNTDDLGSSANGWKDAYAYRYIAKGSTSGTIEYKSDALGNAPNITTLSGTGYGVSWMETRETSDFTGSNVNTVQPVFNTSGDVFTLQGSTAYDFEGVYSFNHGATSHSVGLSFELGGGASVTSITYTTICWVTAIGTNTASQTTNLIQTTANTAVNAAGANATEQIMIKGTINMNDGGTVTPSYTFSAAPGGTVLTKAGSYIKFTPKGTNTFTTIGNVN